MSKKVLYISPNGYLGGAERFVLTALRAHQGSPAVEASVLFYFPGEAQREANALGAKSYVLKNPIKLSNPIRLLRSLCEIRKIIKLSGCEVLHLTMPYAHITGSLASIGLSVKKVWFQHGPVGGILDKIASLFPAHAVIYNSEDLKERHHLNSWARPVMKEFVLRLGVPFGKPRDDLFKTPVLRIGTAGRVCTLKGFHLIIKALSLLKKEGPLSPFSLEIAGNAKTPQDLEYQQSLQALSAAEGLSDEVKFLGHVTDVNKFYRNLDLFIHSSTTAEAFGLVVAEAMSNGCLIIGSDAGGIRDILIEEETGLTYPTLEAGAEVKLKTILGKFLVMNSEVDPDHYRALALAGQQRIHELYSIEQMTRMLETIYTQL